MESTRASHSEASRVKTRRRSIWLCAVSWLVLLPSVAWSNVPVVYHSPLDDGVPLAAPLDIPPGSSHTLYLYLDGGSEASSEIRCATGTGDESCFWNLLLQGAGSVTIAGFTPNPGILHYLAPSGVSIGLNGGDPWRGDLGPQRIGELVIDGGAFGGALELVSGASVSSNLSVDTMVPTNIVPEPATGVSLGVGALLAGVLGRRRASSRAPAPRRSCDRPSLGDGRRVGVVAFLFIIAALTAGVAPSARAQVSSDCGDVVSDGTIDATDLDALRRFLAGDPTAPDLQGDALGLARCDVTGDGVCAVDDYVRIRRYMIDLTGGLDETCPLAGSTYPSVVLAAPVVDQPSTINTDRASVELTGTAEPGELIRVEGAVGSPSAVTSPDGSWSIEAPVEVDALSTLMVRRDFGAGYLSEAVPVSVTQTSATGDEMIAGRVVDGATGLPLAGATVSIHSVSTSSDAFGRFRFEDLPEGVSVLRAGATGYVPAALSTWTGLVYASSTEVLVPLTPMAATQTIGVAGGTLTSPSGFELVVPPGSLPSDTPIALTELVGTGVGLPAVDIGPGTITFDPPAILRVPTSGFAAGQAVDFEQVDQLAGTVSPLVGSTDASGVVELAIASTAGDGFYSDPVALQEGQEGAFFTDGGEFPFEPDVKSVPLSNCDADAPFTFLSDPEFRPQGFTPDPASGVDPGLLSLWQVRPFLGRAKPGIGTLKGVFDPYFLADFFDITPLRGNGLSGVTVPPGKTKLVKYFSAIVEVQQPLVLYRVGDGNWAQKQIGTLSYAYAIPYAVEEVATIDCPRPKASSWGDPHLVRFDHVGQSLTALNGNGRYDFQAAGEFVLYESTEDAMAVQARFVQFPARPSTTIAKAVALDLDGDRVMVDIDASLLRVRVGGVVNALSIGAPVVLPGGGELERLAPTNGQDVVVARWGDSSSLTISLSAFLGSEYLNLYPELAASRAAHVQGLLGNANGILGDDYNLRDGTPAAPADLYTTYADSWRISQVESLFDYEPGEDTSTYNDVPPDPELTLDDIDPVDRAAAEATCIAAGIDEDPLFSECALDVAILGGAATGGALDTLDQIPDRGTYLAVSGQASIFQAGRAAPVDLGGGGGAGVLPSELPLEPSAGRVARVLDSAGAVTFFPSEPSMPTDGVDFGEIHWGSWNDLAGPATQRMGQTMGVFLDDTLPVAAPSAFDCGELEPGVAAPGIGQIFCLGDGRSAFDEPQEFLVPDGATRLFVGFAERLASQLLESDVHHLGDDFVDTGLFALAPDPEGFSWTTEPFAIPSSFTPSSVRVSFDLADTNPASLNSIRVNGVFLSYLPGTGVNATSWTEDVTYSFDPVVLTPTGNTIEFRSSGSNLDDFLIKDVRFEFVPPFVSLPDAGDPGAFHLGDNTGSSGLFALMPTPYGSSWESDPFDAPDADLLADARVILDIAQTDFSGNDVLVNGVRVGFLPVRTNGTVWSSDIAFVFDPELLQTTGNRVTVRATTSGGTNFDDFMMQNVRVEVAPLDAAPPGGYSDNAGVHEFIIEVSP